MKKGKFLVRNVSELDVMYYPLLNSTAAIGIKTLKK